MQTSQKSDYPDQSSEDQHGTFAGPSPRETIAQSTAGKPSPCDDYKTCFTSLTISPDETAVTKSRSHANLQTLMHGRSIRKTMENLNLSLGRSSSRELQDRWDPEHVQARLGHRRTQSTAMPSRVVSNPVVQSTPAPQISTNGTARSSHANPTFTKLPGEIRNHVYRALLAGRPKTMMLRDNRLYNMTAVPDRKPFFKLLPGLSYANRQMYYELSSLLLEEHTMEISLLADLHYLEDALELLPGQKGWSSVRSVKFTRFSDLATSPARTRELFDCMARCRNIEQLTLQVKLDLLHMPEHCAAYRQLAFLNGTPGVKTPDQVASNYELDLLFDLPRLRKFTLICEWHREGPVQCTPRTMATFWDLQDWVAQGFATKADNVKEVFKSLPFNDPKQLGAWTVRAKRGGSSVAP